MYWDIVISLIILSYVGNYGIINFGMQTLMNSLSFATIIKLIAVDLKKMTL